MHSCAASKDAKCTCVWGHGSCFPGSPQAMMSALSVGPSSRDGRRQRASQPTSTIASNRHFGTHLPQPVQASSSMHILFSLHCSSSLLITPQYLTHLAQRSDVILRMALSAHTRRQSQHPVHRSRTILKRVLVSTTHFRSRLSVSFGGGRQNPMEYYVPASQLSQSPVLLRGALLAVLAHLRAKHNRCQSLLTAISGTTEHDRPRPQWWRGWTPTHSVPVSSC